jgi:Ca2+-transporting ATPase
MEWYQIETEKVFEKLKTSSTGITSADATERLKEYGPNKLPEGKGVGALTIIIHQFTSPLIYILMVAAVITAFLGDYIDTGVIVGILIINAIVGFIQEYKAESSVKALKNMVVAKARVLRDGKENEIASEDIVPGDIVFLTSGAKVPADLRLIDVTELRVDESTLTGESVPVEKTVDLIQEEHLTPGDQTNIAFMGTSVVNGRARGIVVETGSRTILGGIARDVQETLGNAVTASAETIGGFARIIGLLVLGKAQS